MQQVLSWPTAPDDTEPSLTLTVALAGQRLEIPAAADVPLVDLIRAAGLPIKAECGGSGVCSTCHVRVSPRWRDLLVPASEDEAAKLDLVPSADDDSRLACQIIMTDALDGLEIELQADSIAPQILQAAE